MTARPGSEAHLEAAALELLEELGWEIVNGQNETPGQLGRQERAEPVLQDRTRDAIKELNPGLDDTAIQQAIDELIQDRSAMDPVRANKDVWELLREGITVRTTNNQGRKEDRNVRYIDWNNSDSNQWLAVSQLWMAGDMYTKRADVVLFVNGIPLGFLEFKAPHKNVRDAYQDNIRDYRATVPQFFWFNGFIVLSNGTDSRMGSTYAPWEHFGEWKKIDDESEPGVVSLETMLRATCDRPRMLDLVENFTVYTERPGGLIKAVAKNHQYLGVNNAIEAVHDAKARDGRLGVFWHTQGSGKSLSMLWFTQKVLHRYPGNWTFVLVTDRKELDDQLYEEFADSDVITPGVEVHADSSAHLRELLSQNHRYVFSLIHKFIPPEKGADMPVLSERDNIIVITDEAHRSQYDTLAGNMRKALPNASFLGFTGTPLIDGEDQATRQVFGDYVSVYNFADSIRDGATVPLYYENRIPELQLTNENFDEELDELLDAAALDEAQEKAVSRRFSQQLQLIKRHKRLEEIAVDLVEHFANRGFRGKGMYVAIDKETAVRMHGLVTTEWQRYIEQLTARLETLPAVERPPVEQQVAWMTETDMAVVVSAAQNEAADMAEVGLDIEPHRRKMNDEDLDSRFKDPEDPFRLVFVCAMWLTGFDAPSTSTLYLDKPMRNHTLMQTIARANRVFSEKENGLIVDYIGVFRNLEKALAIYGSGPAGSTDALIQPTDELRAQLAEALNETDAYLADSDIELTALEAARGLDYVALQAAAAESLLIDETTRKGYVALANRTRKTYKALMPDQAALEATQRVSVIRSIANKIAAASEVPDVSEVMDGVSSLLDRSVGTREYIIRALGDEQSAVDLNAIDWEQLAIKFGGNERLAAKAAQEHLEEKVEKAVRKNPTVSHLADKLRQLIDDYNAGTLNAEEFLRRLTQLHGEMDDEQRRVVEEDLSEAELAIFDLLTKPAPELTDTELRNVRNAAQDLLDKVTDKLVLDWKKKESTRASVRVAIRSALDSGLPDAYGLDLFKEKQQAVYEHFYASFGNDGESVYDDEPREVEPGDSTVLTMPQTLDEVDERHIQQAKVSLAWYVKLSDLAHGEAMAAWDTSTADLIQGAETRAVEFKQTARWNVREQKKDKLMEDIIGKTVSGLANASGGTLLIGVHDDNYPVGLGADLELVKPPTTDGYVNWLDSMLETRFGFSFAQTIRITVEAVDGHDVCRVDVPRATEPLWTSYKGADKLYVRRNNSTRTVEADDIDGFIQDRFSEERD